MRSRHRDRTSVSRGGSCVLFAFVYLLLRRPRPIDHWLFQQSWTVTSSSWCFATSHAAHGLTGGRRRRQPTNAIADRGRGHGRRQRRGPRDTVGLLGRHVRRSLCLVARVHRFDPRARSGPALARGSHRRTGDERPTSQPWQRCMRSRQGMRWKLLRAEERAQANPPGRNRPVARVPSANGTLRRLLPCPSCGSTVS